MHEVSVAQRIVAIAESRADRLGYPSVRSVRVRIGAWTCINADLLRRAFDAAASESRAKGASLEVETVDPECRCRECGSDFTPDEFAMKCEACGSTDVALRHGKELEVVSVEV